jgi:hypothetical protein
MADEGCELRGRLGQDLVQLSLIEIERQGVQFASVWQFNHGRVLAWSKN